MCAASAGRPGGPARAGDGDGDISEPATGSLGGPGEDAGPAAGQEGRGQDESSFDLEDDDEYEPL